MNKLCLHQSIRVISTKGHLHHCTPIMGHSHHGILPSKHSHYGILSKRHLHLLHTQASIRIPTRVHLHHDIPTKGHLHHSIPIRVHLHHDIPTRSTCIMTYRLEGICTARHLHLHLYKETFASRLNMCAGTNMDKLCICTLA